VEVNEGEVVLRRSHGCRQPRPRTSRLRWNCRRASAVVFGRDPTAGTADVQTQMSDVHRGETVTVTKRAHSTLGVPRPVTDVSYNYRRRGEIPSLNPPKGYTPGEGLPDAEVDVERLAANSASASNASSVTNTCHVLRGGGGPRGEQGVVRRPPVS